jgi:hypothetical protein
MICNFGLTGSEEITSLWLLLYADVARLTLCAHTARLPTRQPISDVREAQQ